MKICSKEVVYITHDKKNAPSLEVAPGEIFQVETQLNSGEWLKTLNDSWHPDKIQGPNFTNCIAVKGAKPGDLLAVHILSIIPDDIAYTGFASWRNPSCQKIYPNEWDICYKVVPIEDNQIRWSEHLTLKADPMIGTLGVAPSGEAISNRSAGPHGGNMDVQEIRAGTTVYLTVQVKDALLHIGDVHAIMGDGEINRAGGLECRSRVQLRTDLINRSDCLTCARAEDSEYIMTICCCESMEESFYQSTRALIEWMIERYGFEAREAYMLLGQVMESRCTAIVNSEKPYICKIKKCYCISEKLAAEK